MNERNLYDSVFFDEKPLVDYQMREVFDEVMSLHDEKGVASMLCVVGKRLEVFSHGMDFPFLVGVATREDVRRQGYFKRLFEKFYRRYRNAGAVGLYPVSDAYYKGLGFAKLTGRGEISLNGNEKFTLSDLDAPKLAAFAKRDADIYEIIDGRTAERRIGGWRLDGKRAYYLDNGRESGYAVCDGETVCEYSSLELVGRVSDFCGMTAVTKRGCDTGLGAMWRILNPIAFFDGIRTRCRFDAAFRLTDYDDTVFGLVADSGKISAVKTDGYDVSVTPGELMAMIADGESELGKVFVGARTEFFSEYL